MKKVILALAVVTVAFVACNNGEKKEETKPADTAVVAPKAVDTTKAVVKDTTAKTPAADTTKKPAAPAKK